MNDLLMTKEGVVMAVLELPCYGIVVKLTGNMSGTIESDLHNEFNEENATDRRYISAIDAIESLILAHACAGIDILSPKYIKGIEVAVEAIENNLE